jgi:hypothetical protein
MRVLPDQPQRRSPDRTCRKDRLCHLTFGQLLGVPPRQILLGTAAEVSSLYVAATDPVLSDPTGQSFGMTGSGGRFIALRARQAREREVLVSPRGLA